MLLYPCPTVLVDKGLHQTPRCLFVLDIAENCEETLRLAHFDEAVMGGHVEVVGVGHVRVGRLHVDVVDVAGDRVLAHGLHLRGARGPRPDGVVEVEGVAHLAILVVRAVAVLPRTLHDVERLPLGLEIVEEFRVGEKQREEVVDVEAEVPGDDFSGVLALAPGLVGEYICCRG